MTFQQLKIDADNTYSRYIDKMSSYEARGWEAKVKSGEFGIKELNAHVESAELLGFHRGIYHALRLLGWKPIQENPKIAGKWFLGWHRNYYNSEPIVGRWDGNKYDFGSCCAPTHFKFITVPEGA